MRFKLKGKPLPLGPLGSGELGVKEFGAIVDLEICWGFETGHVEFAS